MGRSLATLGALVLAWVLGLGAGPLGADGMVFPIVGEAQQLEVQAPMQRALLWFREGTWELVIQPAFVRPEGGAAWVVPFPVVPQVAEASVELLDQLELVTAPIFIPFCQPESDMSCMGGSGSSAGGVDDGTLGAAQSGAQVWDSGSTEELDWVVLEAPGPEALIQWLLENDYQVPPVLEDQPEMLDQRFLFAARLREEQDPEAPLPPFRFTLPGVAYEDLEYPLQLTALAAPEEGLDLVLWVAIPNDGATLVPRDLAWHVVAKAYDYSPKQWQQARAKAEAALPEGRGLILEYNGWSLEVFLGAGDAWYDESNWPLEHAVQEAGVALPASWAPELEEMSRLNTRVLRYRGLLGAADMARDLGFKTVDGQGGGPTKSVYKYEVSCFQLELMAQGGDPARAWPGLLLGALAVLATLVGLGTVVFLRIPRGRS